MSGSVRRVSVQKLHRSLEAGEDILVIDCRQPGEYTGPLGHIRGSKLIPVWQIPSAEIGVDTHKPIRIICRSGNRSHHAAKMLNERGFTDVASVDGGMIEWNNLGYPVEKSDSY